MSVTSYGRNASSRDTSAAPSARAWLTSMLVDVVGEVDASSQYTVDSR